jgi:hypothetical protein
MHRLMLYSRILIAGIATTACATEATPTASKPAPPEVPVVVPPVPSPSYTISGVVYDNTPGDRRPAPGFLLEVSSARDTVVAADSVGRYSAPVWGDLVVIEPVASSTFLAPCPSGTDWVGQNPSRSFDVDVVSAAVLSTSGLPASYHTSALYISGTVTEATAEGPRPVSGAVVALGDPATVSYATTLSDNSGRYLVCTTPHGVGTDQLIQLTVAKSGYSTASLMVLPGTTKAVST